MGRSVLRPYEDGETCSRRGFLAVDVFVADVALGVFVDGVLVDGCEHALDFAGMAYDEAAGRNIGALEEQGACGNDAAFADGYAVEDDGAHADEAAVGDVAAVQGNTVADGDVVAEDQRIFVAHDVKDRAVLDIGARADADVVDVAADHRAGPDAGVFADDHVADEHGSGIDVSGGGDFGAVAAIGSDHADGAFS